MRRRKSAARGLYMDFHVSPDDRVGSKPGKRARAARPQKSAPAAKAPKLKRGGDRVEPQFAGMMDFYADEEAPARQQKPRKTRTPKEPKAARGVAAPGKRRRKEKKPLTFGRVVGKMVYWGFVLCIWGVIAVAGVVGYYAYQLPSANTWEVPARPPNIQVLAANGTELANRGEMGGQAVTLREMPEYVAAAVISIEDRRFYDHLGIDPMGIMRAAIGYLQAGGEIVGGGSTITQQLAKNLFLSAEQSIGRKVQEALLALWLERTYSKDQILDLYLNRMFFGNNAYGIEAAAQEYFGKSARNLSLWEAALLAAAVQRPSFVNPKTNPEAAAARARIVLKVMADEGYISAEEASAAAIKSENVIRTRVDASEDYVADWVATLIEPYVGNVTKDLIVQTTIDFDLQKHAEFVVREAVLNQGAERGFTQGALVAMDTDGTVRAIVGGVDYAKSQFNRAVTARRQPGSAFKPFVYLAAMEKGYTPDTIADDAPFDYKGWSPANSTGEYMGPVTLREALAKSLNTISARLAIDVGPDKIVEAATRLGISSRLDAVPSIALGTSEVSLLELTGAYAPFANGGYGVIPNVITSIKTTDGEVLYQSVPAGPGQVIAPEIVGEMNDMLQTALEIGTGKRADLDGWPIAGKTGTSQKARDALFVGFSARMVTGFWLGNDDDTGTKLSGGNVPVEVWSEFMKKAHQGLAISELPGGFTRDTLIDPTLIPMEQAQTDPRSPQTIGDLLGQIFGGN